MRDISIVIPAKDAEKTIVESINSIIDQGCLLEIIVVDDGSRDNTSNLANSFDEERVKVFRTDGLGISGALNLGFQAASGRFIGRCDADDIYLPNRLAWQRRFLVERPETLAVSAGFQTMTETGELVKELSCDGDLRDVTQTLLRGATVTHFCSWLTRTEAIHASGGARNWFVTAEDLDLQFRLAALGPVWHQPIAAYGYRLREGSIMHTGSRALHDFYEDRARCFARQRAESGRDDLERGRPPAIPQCFQRSPAQRAGSHIANHLESQAWQLFTQDGFRAALPWMLRAVRHAPTDAQKWRGLAIMLFKGFRPF